MEAIRISANDSRSPSFIGNCFQQRFLCVNNVLFVSMILWHAYLTEAATTAKKRTE